MPLKTINFGQLDQLKNHLLTSWPTLYHCSKTSTVIPYEKLERLFNISNTKDFFLGDLSSLPKKMEILDNNILRASTSVTWEDAKNFLKEKRKSLMCYPTEELACIGAGVATSATGERSFGFGPLRDQVYQITYMDTHGEIKTLNKDNLLLNHSFFSGPDEAALLKKYQDSYSPYLGLKNGPFPRLERETDLLVGSEGQLGVILEVCLEVIDFNPSTFFMIELPLWDKDYNLHLELLQKIRPYKGKIISAELMDSHSLSMLGSLQIPGKSLKDIVILEINSNYFEEIYNNVLTQLDGIFENQIFEIDEKKYHEIRVKIPREIAEYNNRNKLTKKGTDIQVSLGNFPKLLDYYKDFTHSDVLFNLFGHFGDCHLHFNFLSKENDLDKANKLLEDLYLMLPSLKGSPFAEHGIGILKQPFISTFLSQIHYEMFAFLKDKMDPKNQLFPQGYFNMKRNV